MNVFEIKNLQNSEDRKEKRKTFLRSFIKSVDTGANGTLNYIVKKGSGKNKIAKTKQEKLATVIHLKLYRMRCVLKIVYFFKL